ncbi:MAG: alpha/beta hydrolase [Bacteroidales bacterium]|jgi:pimeloyl-ACP methyl ester carboxylesterase|nr:alpha/beta hydrolase [Bacteroidales bacterium]
MKIFKILIYSLIGLLTAFVFKPYKDPYHKKLAKVGFFEKRAQIGNVNFNYVEGPDNGPALLLLHAQHMDWYSYSRVLPTLSKSFHVFAIDYHGHGKTVSDIESIKNVNKIGKDLTDFIKIVIKEPIYLSGNSSGGILAAWLASTEPELVKSVVLEDPALLSSEYPRVLETIADKSFAICSKFIEEGDSSNFLIYWIDSCKDFFKRQIGFNVAPMLVSSVKSYQKNHPGEAIEIWYLPKIVRLMMRGMNYYNPNFGAAFHNGTWNEGFDHQEALRNIECPAILLHANFKIMEDGTLNGALSQEEADKIVELIPNCKYMRIDSQHVIHLDKPEEYIEIINNFFCH